MTDRRKCLGCLKFLRWTGSPDDNGHGVYVPYAVLGPLCAGCHQIYGGQHTFTTEALHGLAKEIFTLAQEQARKP